MCATAPASRALVLKELFTAVSMIDENEINALVEEILRAKRVFFVGVGRVLLSLQAMCKRLNHLGVPATYVGAIDEPALTEFDLLIVGSGSGESVFPVSIAKIAKRVGARIVQIGSNRNGTVAQYCNLFVRIPCRTKLNLADEIVSCQPMSSLFEQSLLILGDIVAYLIVERKHLDMQTLWYTHANLE